MRRTNWIAVAIAVFALLAAGYAVWEPYTVRQDAAAVQSQAKGLADQVAEACAKGGEAAAELGSACAKAAEVKDQPPVAADVPQIDHGALRQAAFTAVLDYCAARNGCRGPDGATPDLNAIVTTVLARIPPPKEGEPGRDGDAVAAVAAYCGQASDPCRGPAGQKGDSPDCLKEATQCRGRDGEPGKNGPTCPDGFELRDAVITAPDGSTYSGKACVDPASSAPPSADPPLPLGGSR